MGKVLRAEDKVKARFPVTFEAARKVARLKERKLRYQLQHREVDQEGDGGARPPPGNVAPPHRGPRVVDQQDLLNRITSQLEDLSVHLIRAPAPPEQGREEEGVQLVFPLLVCGKEKQWFDGLHDEVKTDCDTLENFFCCEYVPDAQLPQVKRKLNGLKQRLDGDFKAFEWEFEALWRKLLEVTATQNNDYLKLSKFMEWPHEDVRDKVEVDGPTTYADAVAYARGHTKKLLRRGKLVQHTVRFVDEVYEIPDLETEEEVEVGSSSSMDTDSSWEMESFRSRYEAIDILHVENFLKGDVLEEQAEVQEDKLDIGYVKEPLRINEDMQVNEDAIQREGVGQLSSMSIDCSACMQEEEEIQEHDLLSDETNDVCFFYSLLSDGDADTVLLAFSRSDMIMDVIEESLHALLDEDNSIMQQTESLDACKDPASIVQGLMLCQKIARQWDKAPYEVDELSTNEKSHIPDEVLAQIPAHIFIAKFRDEEGDNIKTTIMPREIWTLHQRPEVASAVRAVHLEQFFRLPPWGTDYMRAHELMSSIQYDGKAMLTDSDGAKVEALITKDIINEALQFLPGAYDLIPKTKAIDNQKAFLKVKESKFKYSDLIYSELELPLRLISQHLRVQKPSRYTKLFLHMAVVMALCVAERRQVRCDYAKLILESLIEANLKNLAKNKLYMNAEPMLTRVAYQAYQALGMIEDLPAASSQAALIQQAKYVPKAVRTTSSAASSRSTRSRKSSSEEERTKTDKEQDSQESAQDDVPREVEATVPS
ncbi:hypothetical protein L7F22_061267 [Adiantum nelumboides]|nr:hypothetical protein [Adiantum nelumboides]